MVLYIHTLTTNTKQNETTLTKLQKSLPDLQDSETIGHFAHL